jgi:hypothetical protein
MPKRTSCLCTLLLLLSTSAFAQNVNDLLNIFRGAVQQGMRQSPQGQNVQIVQPSFNCGKARAPDEIAICSNPELSELDNAVAAGNEFARRSSGDIFAKQINTPLFEARQACGADANCIKSRQIAAIKTYHDLGATIDFSMWNHNGSIMDLVTNGKSRSYFYGTPRPEMLSAGAVSGSISFAGESTEEQYVGTAYIFSSNCGGVPFQVSGPALNRKVVLQGQAPRVDAGCRVVGYFAITLEFTLLNPQGTATSAPPVVKSPNLEGLPNAPPQPSETAQAPHALPSEAPDTAKRDSNDVVAQKLDLKDFRTGMRLSEVNQVVRAQNLGCSFEAPSLNCVHREVPPTEIGFFNTGITVLMAKCIGVLDSKISSAPSGEPISLVVTYSFLTTAPTNEVINSISQQYGVSPSQGNGVVWQLTDDVRLTLDLGASIISPLFKKVVLADLKLLRLEQSACEDRRRSLAPVPKF